MAEQQQWNPWRSLREREHIRLRWARLPNGLGGVWARRGTDVVITIDAGLDQVHRNAVLAHELVHDERGLPTSGVPRPLADKEETAVNRVVAERLVPTPELERLIARQLDLGFGVTAHHVADHFDVPHHVAQLALDQHLQAHYRKTPP